MTIVKPIVMNESESKKRYRNMMNRMNFNNEKLLSYVSFKAIISLAEIKSSDENMHIGFTFILLPFN